MPAALIVIMSEWWLSLDVVDFNDLLGLLGGADHIPHQFFVCLLPDGIDKPEHTICIEVTRIFSCGVGCVDIEASQATSRAA